MFLYWKKRGAYELESLPALEEYDGSIAERYVWSSTLDILEELEDGRINLY